jgi:hypothetical protein
LCGCALQEAKIQAVQALVAMGWDINTSAGMYNMLVAAADKSRVYWCNATIVHICAHREQHVRTLYKGGVAVLCTSRLQRLAQSL